MDPLIPVLNGRVSEQIEARPASTTEAMQMDLLPCLPLDITHLRQWNFFIEFCTPFLSLFPLES